MNLSSNIVVQLGYHIPASTIQGSYLRKVFIKLHREIIKVNSLLHKNESKRL